MEFIDHILELYRKPEYQKLTAYYEHQTIYNALGVERNENRHSAFIAWLLNRSESHMLNELPLRRFISLVAASATDNSMCNSQYVRFQLITSNYQIRNQKIQTEQSIVGLVKNDDTILEDIVEKSESGSFKTDSQNRFDIWMLLQISFKDIVDNEVVWNIPVILENKIYSKEGNSTDHLKAQTVRYANAVDVICKSLGLGDNCLPLMVYLTPSGVGGPMSTSFIHIDYQQLLDYVISPASMSAHLHNVSADAHVMIDGYIRNLSCPVVGDDEKYSILAIAESENADLEEIYKSKAFKMVFCAHCNNEAKKLLGEEFENIKEDTLSIGFWNANESLFKVVLYNKYKHNLGKLMIVNRIIKDTNRDNTRYWIEHPKVGRLNINGKPASKSEASYLIFKAYCLLHSLSNPNTKLSLDDLRTAFPGSLNKYYHGRYFQHLFYIVDNNLHFDVPNTKNCDKSANVNASIWDFYVDDAHCFPCVVSDLIRSVKMWRKTDFDALIKKAKEYGIQVTPVLE